MLIRTRGVIAKLVDTEAVSVRFADFVIDLDAAELRRSGQPVRIEPQVFDLIVFLASHPGRVLSREDIVASVWHGRAISDSAISSRINAARRALGDDGATQRFIKTVHGRGFRFEFQAEQRTDPTIEASLLPRVCCQMARAVAIELPDRPAIAIMPFANISGDPQDGFIAHGIAEDLITELSRFEDLFVVSSAAYLKDRSGGMEVRDLVRELGTQFVLEGSIRRSGHHIRITAQLFSAYQNRRVWVEKYDGTLDDLLSLQEHVAGLIAGIVAPKIKVAHHEQALRSPINTNSAHQLAWRAQGLLREVFRLKNQSQIDRAIDLAKTALQLNAKCSIAYQTICDGYVFKNLFRWGDQPTEAAKNAERWAKEFLLHFPNSYMAYYNLAMARLQLSLFEEANRDFKTAHQMNKNDSIVLRFWAQCEAGSGDVQSAKRHALAAIQLSPMDPRTHVSYLALAMCAFIERSNSEFEEWADKAIQMGPSAPIRRALMISYAAANGRSETMETHLNELMSWAPDFIDSLFRGENRPFQREEHMKMLLDGLRKAGFPQTSSRIRRVS